MGDERPEESRTDYLHALLEAMDVAVLVADDEGRYVHANRAACKLLDRSREEVLGSCVLDVTDSQRAADVRAQWAAFLRDGSQSGVLELRLPDGGTQRASFQAKANFVPGRHCSLLTPLPEDTPGATKGTVVICAWTKKVRLDGEWLSIEEYLAQCHGLRVSHGLCPEAMDRFGEET